MKNNNKGSAADSRKNRQGPAAATAHDLRDIVNPGRLNRTIKRTWKRGRK